MPVAAVNGRHRGPTVWLSGAIHGDELNGVEIIRRVLRQVDAKTLRGSIIAVPVVNVFGFVEQSRYLPDGRDLNRSFPGSKRGSLAARLAEIFMREVVNQSDYGIDLHTAASHRFNAPQVRGNLDDPHTLDLATAFGARFMIDARIRDGSLRAAATKRGKPVLLYEAGQIHRFDEPGIDVGVNGVLRVLTALEMGSWQTPAPEDAIHIGSSRWTRARRAGLASIDVDLGQWVDKGDRLGGISDAFGLRPTKVSATVSGYVIAKTQNPLVTQGEALVHIGVPTS
jgi:predicted deacylase